MRAVIQRVKSASVTVDGEVVSSIQRGLVALIGVHILDTQADVDFIVSKILKCKLWPKQDSTRCWEEDVVSANLEVLLVSQFTLYARLKKAKPDFCKAMPSLQARELYQTVVDKMSMGAMQGRVQDGVFGAMMDVALVNDGPVTFVVDSREEAE